MLKHNLKIRTLLIYLNNHIIARIIFSSVRLFWYRYVMHFKIGEKSSILTHFKVSERNNIEIGNHTVINNNCRFDNRFPISIGNNVSITYGTSILTKGHDIDDPDFRTKGAPVVIEDYVWVSAFAIILPGVTLKKGCVVLPGSVVTGDVESYHVVGGNPAGFIRERNHSLCYELHWDPWVPFWG